MPLRENGKGLTARHLAAFAVALAAAGCRGAQVDFRNHSTRTLQDVVVSANGSSTTIARIGPGDSRTRFLCPRGEAGVMDVSFKADGQIHRQQRPVYFECDVLYRVRVEVSPDFDTSVSASLR